MRFISRSALRAVVLLFPGVLAYLCPNLRQSNLPQSPSSRASQPVILELFTSEGCSSCPAADALLKQLDDAGKVNDVEVIPIAEHVDDWDHQGWTDPFSSHAWTERQERYAQSLGLGGIYTPQLVINGRGELVGSSARAVREKIIAAAKIPGVDLQLSASKVSLRSAEFLIVSEKLPPEAHSAELWLAVAERGLSSKVLRGENKGSNLSHGAVLRSLARVRSKSPDSSGHSEARAAVALEPSWKRENLRFVVFLQEPKTLGIFGAAACSLPR